MARKPKAEPARVVGLPSPLWVAPLDDAGTKSALAKMATARPGSVVLLTEAEIAGLKRVVRFA